MVITSTSTRVLLSKRKNLTWDERMWKAHGAHPRYSFCLLPCSQELQANWKGMQAIKEIRRADRDHRLTEPLFLFAEMAFDALPAGRISNNPASIHRQSFSWRQDLCKTSACDRRPMESPPHSFDSWEEEQRLAGRLMLSLKNQVVLLPSVKAWLNEYIIPGPLSNKMMWKTTLAISNCISQRYRCTILR